MLDTRCDATRCDTADPDAAAERTSLIKARPAAPVKLLSKNRKKRTRVAAESDQESDDEAGYFRSSKGDFDEDADEDADEDSDEASTSYSPHSWLIYIT